MEPKRGNKRGRGRGWGDVNAPKRSTGEPRNFEAACAEIKKSVEKFTSLKESSSEESEEEQENDAILQKVLKSYENGEGNTCSSERTQQFLVETLTTGALVCLVCIESVKRTQAIWSCISCYAVFHLPCIQKWAIDSIHFQKVALEENCPQGPLGDISWFCPKCRHKLAEKEKPNVYRCFCSKKKDPSYDPWLIPHSCGEKCGQQLKPNCVHTCLLLCHPGPCPPCSQTVRSSCFCGAQQPTIRRCSNPKWKCGKVCNKVLSCGHHKCNDLCHPGECLPCTKQSLQNCICGKESCLRGCAEPPFQCNQVCKKPLSCGHHFCQQVCHSGKCWSCPDSGLRTCPCRKTKFELPCTQKVPLCGDTCEKPLACNLHTCSQRCHTGECSVCLHTRPKRCRCGAKEKSVPCSKDYTCETKCKKLRNCKKHPCSRKCCQGDCPPCEQLCDRRLPCKNHLCTSQCHLGPCYPCPLKVSITCRCGATKISIPCGREKVTKPPKCKKACKEPPNCHHSKQDIHNCHFGACPPCRQICDKTLKKCGHKCPAPCHDVVAIKTMPTHKRVGPWEPVPTPIIEIKALPCPPCQVLMPLKCLGQHMSHDFPCSELRPWSCEKQCLRLLSCNNHSCALQCHLVEGAPNSSEAGINCGSCDEPCSQPRPLDCIHKCTKPCHSGPCAPCNQMTRRSCHCGLNTCLYTVCSKWGKSGLAERREMLCCQNRCPKEIKCGHRCPLLCHDGDCGSSENCKKKIVLRCPCKRNKQEIICKDAQGKKMDCNAQCREAQVKEFNQREEEEAAKKREKEEIQQKELEEYDRKYVGKKRKHRKSREEVKEKNPFDLSFPAKIAFVSLVAGIVASIVYYWR